jgi:hypothetical protein
MSKLKPLIRKAHTLWDNPLVPTHLRRHNRKAWVRSVLFLGDKWLLAKPVGRVQ